MDVRRRPSNPVRSTPVGEPTKTHNHRNNKQPPLPLYVTNAIFFTLFFSVAYFLLHRWRNKIRTSTPLHFVTPSEIAAILSLLASFFYLMSFFRISLIFHPSTTAATPRSPSDDEDNTDLAHCTKPPAPIIKPILEQKPEPINSDDEEIVNSVVSGSIPSYSLESKLGDCNRAAAIRRTAVERLTSRSLEGLPVEGFDYESILGQCCEMPIGFVQIPVGVAGPLLLDGEEYTVPMATTEGCLVASTNRGCKAIYVSGGASSVVVRDSMTRAPVVRFGSAKRASQLKFFLEDPENFDTLSVVFNK